MSDPKCPYCGEMMKIHVSEFYGGAFAIGYVFCPACGSYGPTIKAATDEEIRRIYDDCKAAALRRPLQKPLEWEEIPDHKLVWMELRGIDKPIPSILRQTMDNQAWYTMESGCVFTFDMDELGKSWRPWASEPSEEERSATEWM